MKTLILIGEKLNGSIPSVGKAIAERDEEALRALVRLQEAAGAEYLDVCASVPEDREVETLRWMLELVQEESDLPICLDSPSPRTLLEAMPFVKKPGILNSVSMEGNKTGLLFPAIAGTGWKCVALCSDEKGIPDTAEKRVDVCRRLLEEAARYSIDRSRLFIDPLVEMICTNEDGACTILDTIRGIRALDEKVHILCAISNVSFQLPLRSLVNQSFATLAAAAGMDAAILDPTNRGLLGAIYATQVCLGQDEYCMDYIGAYRDGLIGPVK